MLFRHIIGYTPSLLIPAVTAFLAVFAYTRLLSPEEYGHYALALNTMNMLCAVFFFWLQVSLPRLIPQAAAAGKDDAFRMTAYAAYAAVGLLVLAVGIPALYVLPLGNFHEVGVIAIPLTLARSILNLNETFHRSYLRFNKYNIIECGQAVLGLAFGLSLVYFGGMGGTGANLGMVLGMVCMLWVDIKTLLRLSLRQFDSAILREIASFGAPLVGSYAIGSVLTTADRYLIGYFRDAAEVGIYSAGFTLVDRIVTMLFMAIATPSFPLVVQRLEREGIEAAQNQMKRNGIATLLLVLPACAGLLVANDAIVELLIGEEFREGALSVLPWIVAASALNGFSTHYFSHSLHLAKRPNLLVWIQLPVSIINLLLNVLLIPRFGYMGAAYTSFISYALMTFFMAHVSLKKFPFPFPFKELFQISASAALMALMLSVISFPHNVIGLAAMVLSGCGIYAIALIAFDVMNIRSILTAFASKVLNK
ncbi:MAG: oligosaccharide flippase family protein [Alphaproteobacteria bacterium]|nr:oligosaccharide flippase family protein [Alphaproteobacteria bacterium]